MPVQVCQGVQTWITPNPFIPFLMAFRQPISSRGKQRIFRNLNPSKCEINPNNPENTFRITKQRRTDVETKLKMWLLLSHVDHQCIPFKLLTVSRQKLKRCTTSKVCFIVKFRQAIAVYTSITEKFEIQICLFLEHSLGAII